MSQLERAFYECLEDAKPAGSFFVSLYERRPFYGGPEEGGWWGSDSVLMAYQEFSSKEAAEAARDAVRLLADGMIDEDRKTWQEHCSRQCDWLDARGLDADYLPETAGPTDYFVTVEDAPGSQESKGDRMYS